MDEGSYPKPLPRIIWIFWDSGEATAPEIVQYCIAGWKRLHPGWKVEVLDRSSAESAVSMSDVPAGLKPAHYADILRLRLLKEYGGVWADATCFPSRPLDDWLPALMQSGFFVFKRPDGDRILANWFIASEAGGFVVSRWEECARLYWRGRMEPHAYFWVHYLFEWLIRTDSKVRRCWYDTPGLAPNAALTLKRALIGRWKDSRVLACLRGPGPDAVPVHKLAWKKGSLAHLEALLAALANGQVNDETDTNSPPGSGRDPRE